MKYFYFRNINTLVFFIISMLAIHKISAAECQNCSQHSADAVIQTINSLTNALKNGKPILFAKNIAFQEFRKEISIRDFNMDEFNNLISQCSVYFLKNFAFLNDDRFSKYAIVCSNFFITRPSADHPTGTSFLPEKNTFWIFIDPRIDVESKDIKSFINSEDIKQIEITDSTNGIIPIGTTNYLEINTENLFEDIKVISQFLKSPDLLHVPTMKTGLANEVLRNIIKSKPEEK